MIDIHYERHHMKNPALPFIFHTDSHFCGESGVANWHENTEFLFCTKGEGNVNCDTTDIHMKKGDTVIVNARCLHTVSSDESIEYHCLIIDNSFFKDNGIDIEKIRFQNKIEDGRIADYFDKIRNRYSNSKDEFHTAETRLVVLDFILYVCKNYKERSFIQDTKNSKSYAAVLDAIEYINNNFSKRLSVDEIADHAGFSRYHFARIFKENTGFTISRYINTRRCDNAAFLLRETSMTVSEICLECGFDNPSYFAKAFTRAYGILPSEYRSRNSKL